MLSTRITVVPDIPPEHGGGFRPGSFDHMLHLQVHQPGMDPQWEHTLVDAHIAPDGASAELTLRSRPRLGVSVDRSLRIVTWQPAAHVRAHDQDGNVLAETKLDAPLQVGQLVEVAGKPYRVAPVEDHELWPHRHPDTGICRGDLDWQHVTLIEEHPHTATPVSAN